MLKKLLKIFRFSNWIKTATIIALCVLVLGYIAPFVHPESAWILPFFGLAYPITVFFCLFLLIYWSIARSKWALVVLFFLAIGYMYHSRLLAIGAIDSVPENAQTTLKVLSNNVRIFDLYNPDPKQKYATRDSIFQYAIDSKAEVVCFQEFYRKDDPTSFLTTRLFNKTFGAVDFHERLTYKTVGRQHFGITIFSKYPIIAKGDVNFDAEDQSIVNFAIFTDIVKGIDTFRVYNIHLQSIKMNGDDIEIESSDWSSKVKRIVDKLRVAYPKRANQAVRIVEHINTSPYPVIVCGDFNDTPISFVYRQFDKVLTDAFTNCSSGIGSTYVGKIPAGRIDYIFHSPELESSNFVIQEKPFSDHRAIECIISKKKSN